MAESNKLRRSQVIMSFGPGSLVDLPQRSVIVCGLSEWDKGGREEIKERRLVEKLRTALTQAGVATGTLSVWTPPAFDEAPDKAKFGIAARLFPTWFVTQQLAAKPGQYRRRRLVGLTASVNGLGKKYSDDEDRRNKDLVPVRFVGACRRGHIEDIDWRVFIHRGKTECQRTLWLEERGTSGELTDIHVGCDCGSERNLYDAADFPTRPLGSCNGRRPWIGYHANEECKEPLRLLVRTASNAYFPETLSVISLPDEDENTIRRLDEIWDTVKEIRSADQLEVLRQVVPAVRAALSGLANDEILAAIAKRRGEMDGSEEDEKPVKEAEFEVLASGRAIIGRDASDSTFYATTPTRAQWDANNDKALERFERLVLIHRLREVRAQIGFTRIDAPAPDVDGELDLNVERQWLDKDITWLPGVEQRGEGIFLQVKTSAIDAWMKRPKVIERVEALSRGFMLWATERKSKRIFPGGPYVLLHTLAHMLLTAIALDCGYPASSLRERVYAVPGRYGLLIHTGTSDAEGTLGGLVESGRRIGDHLRRALRDAALCSNDPVCADHEPDDTFERRFLHGAACHACMLIAEPSCEQRNDLLDRSLVVPTVAVRDAAFFDITP